MVYLFWQNCFTFRLRVFISIWRCFAAQMLPIQFNNSFCYSNALKTATTNLHRYFWKLCIFTTPPHSSPLSLLSSSLHVFSILCYLLHNSSLLHVLWHKVESSQIKRSWSSQGKLNIQSFFKHLRREQTKKKWSYSAMCKGRFFRINCIFTNSWGEKKKP